MIPDLFSNSRLLQLSNREGNIRWGYSLEMVEIATKQLEENQCCCGILRFEILRYRQRYRQVIRSIHLPSSFPEPTGEIYINSYAHSGSIKKNNAPTNASIEKKKLPTTMICHLHPGLLLGSPFLTGFSLMALYLVITLVNIN